MKRLRHEMGKAGMCRKRLKSLASLLTAFSLFMAQSHAVLADISNSATAVARYQSDLVNSAPVTTSIPVAPAAGSFTIVKTVDKPTVSAPGTLSYTIQVHNTGNISLTAPRLTDVLAQGATPLTLTSGPTLVSGDAAVPGVLDTGETWIYSASYDLTQADIDRTTNIVNTVSFDTAETGSVSASATTDISRTPSIALTKTGTFNDGGDSAANVGDTITYAFTVTNTGNVTLTNVTLTDSGATVAGGPIASLAPGAADTTSFSGVYTLTQADIDAGAYANTATVSGTSPTGSNVTNTASATTNFSANGSIAIIKGSTFVDASGDGFAQVGETIRYTFGVKNTGSVALSSVRVTDPLIAVTGGPLALLAAGAEDTTTFTGTYTLTAADIAAGQVANSAKVAGTAPNGSTVSDVSDSTDPADGPYPASYGAGTGSDDSTVEVLKIQSASVTGTVFFDLNSNGILDGDPPAGAGYIVQLLDASGNVIGTGLTGADGRYSIDAPPGTGYTIVFKLPGGGIIGEIKNLTLAGGQTLIDQNLPIDPSGVVYNSVTRQPVAGAIVTITDAADKPLPEACLLAGQQNQVTVSSGIFRFDIRPGADAACPVGQTEYRLRLTPPSGYLPGLSTPIPAQPGVLDVLSCPGDVVAGGSCQVSGTNSPPHTGNGIYYVRFLIGAGNPDVVNNHLPIDPVIVKAPSFTKTAAIINVHRGERVPFKIIASDVSFATARIADIMPPGFVYVNGSARVNGQALEPKVSGQTLTFDGLASDSDRTIRIELLLVTNSAVTTGTHVNTAQFIDPASGMVLATAKASVEVIPEPVFDCGEIIGRVFDDKNRNGYLDKGEDGLPGVRVATVKGLLVTTDKFGRFHIACADIPDADIGSNFLMKLDTRTLPTGYRLTTENPRDVRLTRGKITKLNFGAAITRVVRLDLKDDAFETGTANLKPQWSGGIDRLIAILAKEPSTLRLTYTSAGDKASASKRLVMIEKLIAARWRKRSGGYELPIESRVMGTK